MEAVLERDPSLRHSALHIAAANDQIEVDSSFTSLGFHQISDCSEFFWILGKWVFMGFLFLVGNNFYFSEIFTRFECLTNDRENWREN